MNESNNVSIGTIGTVTSGRTNDTQTISNQTQMSESFDHDYASSTQTQMSESFDHDYASSSIAANANTNMTQQSITTQNSESSSIAANANTTMSQQSITTQNNFEDSFDQMNIGNEEIGFYNIL
jgi:hypothetical protein